MFPQAFNAMYGNPFAIYGNIQYARFEPVVEVYGAWPEENPTQKGMLVSDWQEPAEKQETPSPELVATQNVEIIRRLRAELAATQDASYRQVLRDQIEEARKAKVKAFMAAAIDEEETEFLLLH